MDFLIGLAVSCPGCLRFAGGVLTSVAVIAMGMGSRIGRLVLALEHLAPSVTVDPFSASLPWWIGAFVPETTLGWATWWLLLACGGYAVWFAGWVERQVGDGPRRRGRRA